MIEPSQAMATRLAHRWLLLLLFQLQLLLLILPQPCLTAGMPAITTKILSSLPGFSGPLPFSLETGYVELDDGVRFFYYFIQSERSPEEDPVLLWLTGGPGCSSLSSLVYEVGPLAFDFEGYQGGLPTLRYKPASWTKVSNIIFVDSPAGTGFSYDPTDNGLTPSDTIVVHQLHTFLEKWFDEHPQFLSNPLYIAGDSYSGMIIPSLTLEIAKGIESGDEHLPLNLKGYTAGNPMTDLARFDGNSKFPYLHRMGIIPDELYEVARESCRGEYTSPSNALCANAVQSIHDIIKDVNAMHILEPRCDTHPSLTIHKAASDDGRKRQLQSMVSSICRNATYILSEFWANDETVRESLGIHKGTVPTWRRHAHFPYIQDINSTVEYHLSLITKGYRAIVYSGDHDSEISFVGTQAWIKYLNLSITDDWRPWYVDGQVAGFTRTYSNNLTYATVKGAGHTAPEYTPRECLAMIDRWLSGEPL